MKNQVLRLSNVHADYVQAVMKAWMMRYRFDYADQEAVPENIQQLADVLSIDLDEEYQRCFDLLGSIFTQRLGITKTDIENYFTLCFEEMEDNLTSKLGIGLGGENLDKEDLERLSEAVKDCSNITYMGQVSTEDKEDNEYDMASTGPEVYSLGGHPIGYSYFQLIYRLITSMIAYRVARLTNPGIKGKLMEKLGANELIELILSKDAQALANFIKDHFEVEIEGALQEMIEGDGLTAEDGNTFKHDLDTQYEGRTRLFYLFALDLIHWLEMVEEIEVTNPVEYFKDYRIGTGLLLSDDESINQGDKETFLAMKVRYDGYLGK